MLQTRGKGISVVRPKAFWIIMPTENMPKPFSRIDVGAFT